MYSSCLNNDDKTIQVMLMRIPDTTCATKKEYIKIMKLLNKINKTPHTVNDY